MPRRRAFRVTPDEVVVEESCWLGHLIEQTVGIA